MFTRWLTFLACLSFAAYLAADAMPRQRSAQSPPGALSAPAVVHFEPTDLDGRMVLDRAVKSLKGITWLRVTIWQRLHREAGYESSGELTLGPNECAALDLTVRTSGGQRGVPVRQRVICDGQAIATVLGAAESADHVRGQKLPENPRARTDLLHAHGCATPAVLLRQLRNTASRWQVERGSVDNVAVLRLTGRLDGPAAPESRWAALGASWCSIELDAETLWPRRFEWRRRDDRQRLPLVLEMEYRDPLVNQPLSLEDCKRVFSYQP